MNELLPIIRRVRRPLFVLDGPTVPTIPAAPVKPEPEMPEPARGDARPTQGRNAALTVKRLRTDQEAHKNYPEGQQLKQKGLPSLRPMHDQKE